MFGFGNRSKHDFSAEAIADGTLIARYPLARIQALAASEAEAAQELRELVQESMDRLHSLLLILGRTTAEEKVGCFLLLMQRRVGCGPTGHLVLPLTRYDVADYLALSVETVSRCLTALRQRGVISLSGPRQIGIVDPDALVDQRDVGVIDRDALLDRRKMVETRPAPPRTAPQVSAGAPQSPVVAVPVPGFPFAEALSGMRGWL